MKILFFIIFFNQIYFPVKSGAIRETQSLNMCDYDCKGVRQTLCSYCPPGPKQHCKADEIIQLHTTPQNITDILDAHNKVRSLAATGSAPFTHNKTSSLMYKLTWNQDLAKVAQRWNYQCDYENSDYCRVTHQFDYVGQNLAAKGDKHRVTPVKELFQVWMNEGALIQYNNEVNFTQSIIHYAQVLSGRTLCVGCGVFVYKTGEYYVSSLVCNYGPGFDEEKSSTFEKGVPCSQCKLEGETCDSASGLCICTEKAGCYIANDNSVYGCAAFDDYWLLASSLVPLTIILMTLLLLVVIICLIDTYPRLYV